MVRPLSLVPLMFRAISTSSELSKDRQAQPLGCFVNGSFTIVILDIVPQSSNISCSSYLVDLQSTFQMKIDFASSFFLCQNLYKSSQFFYSDCTESFLGGSLAAGSTTLFQTLFSYRGSSIKNTYKLFQRMAPSIRKTQIKNYRTGTYLIIHSICFIFCIISLICRSVFGISQFKDNQPWCNSYLQLKYSDNGYVYSLITFIQTMVTTFCLLIATIILSVCKYRLQSLDILFKKENQNKTTLKWLYILYSCCILSSFGALGIFIAFVIDVGNCTGNRQSKWVTMIVLLGLLTVLLVVCWLYIFIMHLGSIQNDPQATDADQVMSFGDHNKSLMKNIRNKHQNNKSIFSISKTNDKSVSQNDRSLLLKKQIERMKLKYSSKRKLDENGNQDEKKKQQSFFFTLNGNKQSNAKNQTSPQDNFNQKKSRDQSVILSPQNRSLNHNNQTITDPYRKRQRPNILKRVQEENSIDNPYQKLIDSDLAKKEELQFEIYANAIQKANSKKQDLIYFKRREGKKELFRNYLDQSSQQYNVNNTPFLLQNRRLQRSMLRNLQDKYNNSQQDSHQ